MKAGDVPIASQKGIAARAQNRANMALNDMGHKWHEMGPKQIKGPQIFRAILALFWALAAIPFWDQWKMGHMNVKTLGALYSLIILSIYGISASCYPIRIAAILTV